MLRAFLYLCITIILFTLPVRTSRADLPVQTRRGIESATQELAAVRVSAKQFLLERFDKKLEITRASTKLTDDERKSLIASLEAERALFAKQGSLPFSPTMRADLLAYVGKLKKAEGAYVRAYDNGIAYHTRKGENDDAQTLKTETEKTLAPQVIAVWALSLEGDAENSYNRTMKSDGTTQNGSWMMDENKIVLRSPNAKAPGGAWILTCIVQPDGRHLTATNQSGNKFEGKLVLE